MAYRDSKCKFSKALSHFLPKSEYKLYISFGPEFSVYKERTSEVIAKSERLMDRLIIYWVGEKVIFIFFMFFKVNLVI